MKSIGMRSDLSAIIVAMVTMIFCRANAYAEPIEIEDHGKIWPHYYFIEEGTSWEMEVKDLDDENSEPFIVTQTLRGFEKINDKIYINLYSKVGDEEEELISYIRMYYYGSNPDDCNSIYAMPVNADGEEKLIYVMSSVRPVTVSQFNWDGTLSGEQYIVSPSYHNTDWEYRDIKFSAGSHYVYAESDIDMTNPLGTVEWSNYFGGMHGFTNQLYCVNDKWESKLLKVTTSCNGVIYDSETAGIDAVENEDAAISNGVKYKLDGTLFGESDRGIYIMNGKKYIKRLF